MKAINGDVPQFVDLEPLFFETLQCQGATSATTAFSKHWGNPVAAHVILAQYMDASDYAFFAPGIAAFPSELIVYAAFGNGVPVVTGAFVKMFLGGATFADGSTSIDIPCGTGKRFAVIGTNIPALTPIIGVTG